MHTVELNATNFANPIVDWFNNTLPLIPGALVGLLLGILFVRISVRVIRWFLKLTHIPKGMRQIVTSTIETLLWFLLLILVLQALGFKDILVFFSSSALALGIVLAAGGTTLLSDLVAGIFLARDADFNVGDEIMAGENQVQGVIESMDVRRVRLRDEKGLLHILPNSIVERKEWVVIKKRDEITPLAKVVSTARAKTASKLRTVAMETKNAMAERKPRLRKKDQ